MTLKDFLKRVDIEKDGDKMLLWCEVFVVIPTLFKILKDYNHTK